MPKSVETVYVKKVFTCKPGKKYPASHFDTIIDTDVDVMWKDEHGRSRVLCRFRKKVIPDSVSDLATEALKSHSKRSHSNRGYASGEYEDGKMRKVIGNQSRSLEAKSNISGYFDRPYQQIQKHFDTKIVCRATSFTQNHPDKFALAMPFFQAVDKMYKILAPAQYKLQKAMVAKVPTGMSIGDTVFTTVTSNYNWRTAAHQDSGDYEDGLSNLVVTGDEKWSGCYLGFPEFKVAIDVRKGDFLLMDVHQWHCNTPLKENGGFRLSFVCYARENMQYCTHRKVIDGQVYWYKGKDVNKQ
jgi:Oxygenase domain of the 2OGFeDO superfamily